MLRQLSAFLNNYVALEKTLRFFQAVTMIGAALMTLQEDAAPWLQARSHLAVARRFFRLHKWIDSGHAAYAAYTSQSLFGTLRIFTFLKQSFLATYLFLEALTITDTMGMTNFHWGPGVFREAQKFWFYAIATSAILQLYALYTLKASARELAAVKDSDKGGPDVTDKQANKLNDAGQRKVLRQLAIDCLDLSIPGSFLGWVAIEPLLVGIAMSAGSLLSMSELWAQINGP